MLNPIGKAVLVTSSLAPVAFGYGVAAIAEGRGTSETCRWFVMGAGLTVIAALMPWIARDGSAPIKVKTKGLKNSDKEVLVFLVTYMIPFISKPTFSTEPSLIIIIYVFGVIFISVYHTNMFTFNPMLALFGYHFYEIETEGGMKDLLVSKSVFREQVNDLWIARMAEYVYLEVEEPETCLTQPG
ncbi:hypothetical protein [Paludisphaera rhizosphaerae]|uniref:hypothetical protein n=1 Tax=Paludisphaera rhizosphaerae TaxID=2711216 RepID=UPI0013ED2C3E|nr:hypothetical protein [Paludisphaera rhizosphaerae]